MAGATSPGKWEQKPMNAKRSLLGLSFCTCYLASHLTNKVSGRVAATARGPGAPPSTAPKLAVLMVLARKPNLRGSTLSPLPGKTIFEGSLGLGVRRTKPWASSPPLT